MGVGRSTLDLKINVSPKRARAFRRSLLSWYRRHGRDLPWRHTREPYRILVSEIMLQQTQVQTVLPYYNRWLRRFPNFRSLSRATENDILHAWQGLGYYNRARNLQASAGIVQTRYRGLFPRKIAAIRDLPGIGQYTANAVAAFCFDQSAPIVEANTSRVLARLFDLRVPIDRSAGRKMLWTQAAELLPPRNAGVYNSALIDLGALICLPQPKCGICPVKRFCGARRPETLPVRKPAPRSKRLVENHALISKQNKILLEQAHRRWRGMWILPPLRLDRFNRSSLSGRPIHSSVFPFTNHRVTLRVFRQRSRQVQGTGQRWFSLYQLNSIPIPSPHRRAITALLI